MSKRSYPSGVAKRKVTLDKKTKVESLHAKIDLLFQWTESRHHVEEECEETDTLRVSTGDERDLKSGYSDFFLFVVLK